MGFGDESESGNITELNAMFLEQEKKINDIKISQRKTRMHSIENMENIQTKRRRSARLAKLKNNDNDSDDLNDAELDVQTNRKKKRVFSAMNNACNGSLDNMQNEQKQNKIARISAHHTSPRMDGELLKKKHRRNTRRRNQK